MYQYLWHNLPAISSQETGNFSWILLGIDIAAREFQISQEVAKRDASRMQLLEIEYRFGEGDSNTYLNSLNSLDGRKAQTYRAWSAMRSRIEKIKLLVLGVDE